MERTVGQFPLTDQVQSAPRRESTDGLLPSRMHVTERTFVTLNNATNKAPNRFPGRRLLGHELGNGLTVTTVDHAADKIRDAVNSSR